MLQAKDLSLSLNQQTILQTISVSAEASSVLGVLGPNGAGKTSLLKMLAGQLSDRGQVLWRDAPITEMPIQKRAQQISFVGQHYDMVFSLTLEQVVRMGRLPHQNLLNRWSDKDQGLVDGALAKVGLSAKAKMGFEQLSGGEQQRGFIARALVQQAELLIFDEPINHLDVYYQHQILSILKQLAQQAGKAVVVSLHDLNLAADYCDQLCLLAEGRLVDQGTPANVLQPDILTKVFKLPCQIDTKQTQPGVKVSFFANEISADSMNTEEKRYS